MSRRTVFAAILLFCCVSVHAQEIDVDISACRAMFKIVKAMRDGCVPAIAEVRFNTFTPELTKSWKAHVANEAKMVKRQVALLDRALSGDLSEEELNADLREYWLSGAIGRAYVIGSEMFGAIYVAFGKDEVFSAMKDLRRLFSLYNAALDAKPDVLAGCVRVPERAVKQALAIGTHSPSHE